MELKRRESIEGIVSWFYKCDVCGAPQDPINTNDKETEDRIIELMAGRVFTVVKVDRRLYGVCSNCADTPCQIIVHPGRPVRVYIQKGGNYNV